MLGKADVQNLQELLMELNKADFSKVRFYVVKTREMVVSVMAKGNVFRQDSEDVMYSIEGCYQGKKSRIYTNQLTDYDYITTSMKMTAEVYEEYIEDTLTDVMEAETEKEYIWDKIEDIVPVLLSAEKIAYQRETIRLIRQCCYEQRMKEIYLIDEQMNIRKDADGYHCFKLDIVAKKENFTKSASACVYGERLKRIDVMDCVEKTVSEAADSLGGEVLASGSYSIIIGGSVMAELLDAYLSSFYADNIQNKMSGLGDKRGEQIAAPHIELKEIPQFEQGHNIRMMDDEGIAVKEKFLIHQGVMQDILYNQSAAKRDGVKSTGNGFRSTVQSDVEIGVTNLILGTEDPDKKKTIKEMEQLLGDGLIITNVDGTFAGANSKTGAFSLIAEGRIVKNGQSQGAFREITIAGNFFDMLNQISYMSKDMECTWPDAASVLSPSVMVGQLTIAGK